MVAIHDGSFTSTPAVGNAEVPMRAVSGQGGYAYAPLPDFKGRDQFVVRACAIVGERKGCSTLIYDVTVR